MSCACRCWTHVQPPGPKQPRSWRCCITALLQSPPVRSISTCTCAPARGGIILGLDPAVVYPARPSARGLLVYADSAAKPSRRVYCCAVSHVNHASVPVASVSAVNPCRCQEELQGVILTVSCRRGHRKRLRCPEVQSAGAPDQAHVQPGTHGGQP